MAEFVARVGLQLLLEPSHSAGFAKAGCVLVGAAYPVYATFKAVSPLPPPGAAAPPPSAAAEKERWLRYWAVLAAATLAESTLCRLLNCRSLNDVFGAYPHAKLAFLSWLHLRSGAGTVHAYQRWLLPVLRRYEPKVDVVLHHCWSTLAAMYAMYEVPINQVVTAAGLAAHHALTFLRWFFLEDPASAPNPPAPGGAGGGGSVEGEARGGSSRQRRGAAAAGGCSIEDVAEGAGVGQGVRAAATAMVGGLRW